MPKVSIIILNWNGREHLQECLESLEGQTFRDFETIVVDNGSSDGSQDYIKKTFTWVRLVELLDNNGFAGGNVAGYHHSGGSLVVTLNNDTVVEKDWLEELVAVAEEHPGTGMVASRICSYYDHDRIDSLGMSICLDGMSRGNQRGELFSRLKQLPEQILLPSACSALYRREMIDQIGFFDESFFAYCEDTDLGLRGRLAGWDARLAEKSVVYHKYSASAGSFSPFKLFLVERNHFWVVFKNFPAILLILLPLTTCMRFFFLFLVVLKSSDSGGRKMGWQQKVACVKAVILGIFHALFSLHIVFLERKKLARIHKIKSFEFVRLLLLHKMKFSSLIDPAKDFAC